MDEAKMVKKQIARLTMKLRKTEDVEALLRVRNALIGLCNENDTAVTAADTECPPGYPNCLPPSNPPPDPDE